MSRQRLQPRDRNGFRIAIICALPLEADMVLSMFDSFWESESYGKAAGDQNAYTTGMIGNHNVVLAHLPSMGTNKAATVAQGIRSSYQGIEVAFVVGVCGVTPIDSQTKEEIVLGDCIFSTTVVQYDFGAQYPQGFSRKNRIEDSLGGANFEIKSLLSMLRTEYNRKRLADRLWHHMMALQKTKPHLRYPGMEHDRLFPPSYIHQYRGDGNISEVSTVGNVISLEDCARTGCEDAHLVSRQRLQTCDTLPSNGNSVMPVVHFGRFGSANTVMKSGLDRDRVAEKDDLIAFEMEGSGVSDSFPTMVIKSACDYADSHKNKEWQPYAAATAAAGLKAFLERWKSNDQSLQQSDQLNSSSSRQNPSLTVSLVDRPLASTNIPFGRDKAFVHRNELDVILGRCQESFARVALIGLGGIGKSQIAIEFVWRIRQASPEIWVLWFHASNRGRLQESCRSAADLLDLQGRDDPNINLPQLIGSWLANRENGKWVVVIDNADDIDVVPFLSRDFLPEVEHGRLLVTSRNKDVAYELIGNHQDIVELGLMDKDAALTLFKSKYSGKDEEYRILELLDQLDWVPLAISQAAAFIQRRHPRTTVTSYLELLKRSSDDKTKLLRQHIVDRRRDEHALNSTMATWQITFEYLNSKEPYAADLLSFMSLFDRQGIPESLVSQIFNDNSFDNSIETLRNFSLIKIGTDTTFEIHRLVQFVTRSWLQHNEKLEHWKNQFLETMDKVFPWYSIEERNTCLALYPHAQLVLDYRPKNDEMLVTWIDLLKKVLSFDNWQGFYNQAEVIALQAWRCSESLYGADDMKTMECKVDMAYAVHGLGKFAEAEHFYRQILDRYEKTLSPHHPDVLRCMGYLAEAITNQGRFKEAEQLYNQLLLNAKDSEKEGLATLSHICSFMRTLGEQAKYDEAERIGRKALADSKQASGINEGLRIDIMQSLALILKDQGKIAEAKRLGLNVVTKSVELLGSDHLDTLVAKGNLALILNSAGEHSRAMGFAEDCVKGKEKLLGPEHPDTLRATCNLALILADQGEWSKSADLARRALSGNERVLGERHPSTLKNYYNLAWALDGMGDLEQAESLYYRAASGQRTEMGVTHPDTRWAVRGLLCTLHRLGSHRKIEQLIKEWSIDKRDVMSYIDFVPDFELPQYMQDLLAS